MTPEIPVATERDVLITRVFAAPRDLVWRFFTEAPRLAEWFGPVGVHVDPASVTVEPRVGGRWELTMIVDSFQFIGPPDWQQQQQGSGGASEPKDAADDDVPW